MLRGKVIKDSKGRDSYSLPIVCSSYLTLANEGKPIPPEALRKTLEHLAKLIYEKDVALEMAMTYFNYVQDFSYKLHKEADGSPSVEGKVINAYNNVIPEKNYGNIS